MDYICKSHPELFEILENDISLFDSVELRVYTDITPHRVEKKEGQSDLHFSLGTLYSLQTGSKQHIVDYKSGKIGYTYDYDNTKYKSYKVKCNTDPFNFIIDSKKLVIAKRDINSHNIISFHYYNKDNQRIHYSSDLFLNKDLTDSEVQEEVDRHLTINTITGYSRAQEKEYPYYDDNFGYSSFIPFLNNFYKKEVSTIYKQLYEKYDVLFTDTISDTLFTESTINRVGFNFQNLILIAKLKGLSDSLIDHFCNIVTPIVEKFKYDPGTIITSVFRLYKSDSQLVKFKGAFFFLEEKKAKLETHIYEYLFSSKTFDEFIDRVNIIRIYNRVKKNLENIKSTLTLELNTFINKDFGQVIKEIKKQLKTQVKNVDLFYNSSEALFYFTSKKEYDICESLNLLQSIGKFKVTSHQEMYIDGGYFGESEYVWYEQFQRQLIKIYQETNNRTLVNYIHDLYLLGEKQLSLHDVYYDSKIIGDLYSSFSLQEFEQILSKTCGEVNFENSRGYLNSVYSIFSNKELVDQVNCTISQIFQEYPYRVASEYKQIIYNIVDQKFFELYSFTKKQKKHLLRNSKTLQHLKINWFSILNTTFKMDISKFKQVIMGQINKNIKSSRSLSTNYYYSTGEQVYKLSEYLKLLLGTKQQKGIAYKPGKMFQQIKNKNLLSSICQDSTLSRGVQDLLLEYSPYKGEILKFKVQLEDVSTPAYWCSGDFSKCCMGYTSEKMKDYMLQAGYGVVNIYYNNLIIANSLIWMSYVDGKKTLVVDNIEVNPTYKKYGTLFSEIYKNYFEQLKNENNCLQIIMGNNYNDLSIQQSKQIEVKELKLLPLGFKYSSKHNKQIFSELESEEKEKKTEFDKFKTRFYTDLGQTVKIITQQTVFA